MSHGDDRSLRHPFLRCWDLKSRHLGNLVVRRTALLAWCPCRAGSIENPREQNLKASIFSKPKFASFLHAELGSFVLVTAGAA